MSNKKQFWHNVIGEEWYNFFPELWDSPYMESVLTYISGRYDNATVYPSMQNLFKAFKLCPYDKFKVLILSNSEYDEESKGLLFDDVERVVLKSSTQIINDAIERDVYDGFNISFDITLEEWAKQGVLLLNTSLTHERFGTSHESVWQDFISAILTKVTEINGFHVCLWGDKAKSFKYRLDENKIHIYEEIHPLDTLVDWQCNHFKEINKKIMKQNGKEDIIAW